MSIDEATPSRPCLNFDLYQSLSSLAEQLLKDGNSDDAIMFLRLLTERFPGSRQARLQLAGTLLKSQRQTEAQEVAECLLKIDPNYGPAYLLLARLAEDHDREQARLLVERGLTLDPDNVELIEKAVDFRVAANQFQSAVDLLRTSAQRLEKEPRVYLKLGVLLTRMKLFDDAQNILSAALTAWPGDDQLHEALVRCYQAQGAHQQMLSSLNRAHQLLPASARITALMVDILEALGQGQLAKATLGQGIVASGDPGLGRRYRSIVGSKPDQRLVVFLTDMPRGRVLKMGAWLRRHGWRSVLLTAQQPYCHAGDFFDEVKLVANPEHALCLAAEYSPRAYHVSTWLGDDNAVALINARLGKIVFDMYDGAEGLIEMESTVHAQKQRYCIEHADALCARDLRSRYLLRTLGYRRPPKLIFFPEYCGDAEQHRAQREYLRRVMSAGELHLVSCGYVGTRSTWDGSWDIEFLVRRLHEDGIHFHLYPHPVSGCQIEQEYRELEERLSSFHFHPPVNMDEIVPELCRYQVGVSIQTSLYFKRPLKGYTTAHFKFCLAHRNVDYLEAGLPVVLNPELETQYWFLKRKGLAIPADDNFFNNPRGVLQTFLADPGLETRLERAQREYSMDAHITRLIAFYESL